MFGPGRLSAGDVFADRYEIVARLGTGGMSAVYAARHLRTDRRVAVKLLDAGIATTSEARARFAKEARLSAAIDSPHVVDVIDAGVDAKTELPFLVMELLDGETLGARVTREGRLEAAQVVAIVRQIASALDRAHARGIVHRDIKPDNIYLARAEGGVTSVKLLDFGIAKTEDAAQTATGQILGTPLYMAREQIDGGEVTPLADVSALGNVAYYALVGSPYWAKEPTVRQVLLGIVIGPRESASARASTDSVVLPPAFDAWFARCVAADPRDRFPSAGDAAVALAAVFDASDDVPIAPAPERRRDDEKPHPTGAPLPGGADAAAAGAAPAPLPMAPPPPKEATGWASLDAVLPAGLAPHAATIGRFLRALFAEVEPMGEGIVRLTGPRIEGGATREFFAVFMGEGERGDRRMLTATFLGYVDPLAAHLERLDTSRRKVVLAIVDSLELGGGVHHKIFEFNERFAAMVLPLHVGDLAGAADAADAAALFRSRLSDFHVFPDVFGAGGRTAASRFGTRATINDLTATLNGKTPFVVVYGPHGSGKTSLIDTVAGELPHKAFVKVRCSVGAPGVAALVRRICAALSGDADAAETDGKSIGDRLTVAIDRARAGRSVVLVLDDADWPVRALVDPAFDGAELSLLRELWLALSDAVDAGKVAVVVTGTSAFLLLKTALRGWLNPLRNREPIELQPLTFADLRKMMTDLGAQVNARFDDGAIDEVYAQSGGDVHVARLLCRSVVVPKRSSSQVTPLHEIVVTRADARSAGAVLAETPDTFTDTIVASLDEPEQLVLKVVADARPRAVAQIWRALEGRCTTAACSDALERLLKMRFVAWRDGRARVAIPLLERWARLHLEPIAREAARVRAARLRYAALGASFSALVAAGYVVWTAERSIAWSSASCGYRAAYPSRAVPDVAFTLRVIRQCDEGADDGSPFGLYPGADTSVRFDTGASGSPSVSEYRLTGREDGKAWRNDQVRVTFHDMNRDAFVVDVRSAAPGAAKPTAIVVQKDWIGNLSTAVKTILAIAGAAPALIGLLAAFHDQMRAAIRRLVG